MITFASVTKAFGDDLVALQDVSFHIEPGELVVITGPSGSGKTTLMRLLTKEYEPTEGEITFNDTQLHKIKGGQVHKHRRQIGVIFQDYKLLPELNVWENIALSLYITGQKQNEIEQRVTDLLRLISLDDKPFLFPSQLSGGEAQRVSIARALATAPSVIFADEPTGNLDAETSASIARLLQKINKLGTTVLIATHDVSVLDLMEDERHIRLEKGKLVKDEPASTKGKKTKTEAAPKAAAPEPKAETKVTAETPKTEAKKAEPPKTQKSERSAEIKPPGVTPPADTDTTPPTMEPKPKKSLLGKIWPFGKKKVEEPKTEETSSVIALGAPANAASKAESKPDTKALKEELKDVAKSSQKPASQTTIDDKDAKVKVESLWLRSQQP